MSEFRKFDGTFRIDGYIDYNAIVEFLENVMLGIYQYDGIFYHTFFDSIDNFSIGTVGAASSVECPEGMEIHVNAGNTTGDYANFMKLSEFQNYVNRYASWDKNRRFKTVIHFSTNTNQTVYVCTGAGMEGAETVQHIGFKIVNNKVYGSVADGVTETLTDELFTIIKDGTENQKVKLECVYTAGSKVQFYVNDVLKDDEITTGLPSGYENVYAHYLMTISLTADADQLKNIMLSEWMFLQES